MALYEFFTSRNNSANVASFVGQAGRLFYDGANGVIKLSDGVTPGGTFIPYNIATTETIGGIKAGPGANVSVDGTLTIDTSGLPLGIGNLSIVDTTISTVNANQDVVIESNGTGNVELVGNIQFYTTAQGNDGTPFFTASSDGQVTILVPAADPLAGAVKIVGSTTGRVSPPLNTGVMLQLTGNNNDPSRFYNDSVGNFAAFVGRRINGNVAVPTAVQAGDEIIRISSTGHNGNTVPGSGSARILYTAKETYTTSAAGTNLSIWTTAIGSTVLTKTATFDREMGLTVNGNITVTGSIFGNATTTVANVGTLNVSGNTAISGFYTGKYIRTVRNAGTIADGGTLTINFATDAIVHCIWGNGLTIEYSNFLAGRVVKVMCTKSSGTGTDTLSLDGVTASQVSSGSTTINASADTTTFLELTCVGTSIGNVFIKV